MTPYSSLQGQGVVGFFSESLSEQIFHFLSYMILHTCEGTGGGGGGGGYQYTGEQNLRQ